MPNSPDECTAAKYFEVNFGEGLVPIDKLMGTWHDGSDEGPRLIEARRAGQD